MNAISSFIYNALEWITRFAYLNLLWILLYIARRSNLSDFSPLLFNVRHSERMVERGNRNTIV